MMRGACIGILSILTCAPAMAQRQSPAAGWQVAYRGAQAALVATAAYDYHETVWGLHNTTAIESGEASWFVNDRSANMVVGFNLGEDALVLWYGHWSSQRHSGWLRWSGIGLMGLRSWFHVSGGRTWRSQPRRSMVLYQREW